MNFNIIPAALNCLRKGEAVEDPALWKTRGEALKAALAAFILSLQPVVLGVTGYDLHITPEVSGGVATAAVWLVGLFFTAATSKTVGLLPARAAAVAGPAGDAPAGGQGPLGAPVGGQPAVARAADSVRPVARSSDPAQDDLRGGP